MVLGKSYAAHCSFINQIEYYLEYNFDYFRYLFTSAIFDECLMKWKVVVEAEYWDIDNLEYNINKVLFVY